MYEMMISLGYKIVIKKILEYNNNNNNMYFIYKILEQGVQTSKIYDPNC